PLATHTLPLHERSSDLQPARRHAADRATPRPSYLGHPEVRTMSSQPAHAADPEPRFGFDNTYARELPGTFVAWQPAKVPSPRLLDRKSTRLNSSHVKIS